MRFEHHSFPLDLAALNADKIVRCTSENIKSFSKIPSITDNNQYSNGEEKPEFSPNTSSNIFSVETKKQIDNKDITTNNKEIPPEEKKK